MEAQREKGHKVTASRYIRVAIRQILGGARKEPTLTLHMPDREPVPGVHFAFVSNSSPWTYANEPAGLDESHHHLRDGAGRVRHDEHERVGEPGAGATDVVAPNRGSRRVTSSATTTWHGCE